MAVCVIGSSEYLLGDWAAPVPWSFAVLLVLLVGVVGLLVAEFMLRLMRPLIESGFLLRYAVVVLGVFLGGMLGGISLIFGTFVIFQELLWIPYVLVAGRFIGLVVGFFVAAPLAATLGRFGINS